MAIIVPIKLSNGTMIRNLKDFKDSLTNLENITDILQFIVSGDLENFLKGLGKMDLVEIIQRGKESKKSPLAILKELVTSLGIKIEHSEQDNRVSIDIPLSIQEIKEKILGETETCILPPGVVEFNESLILKSQKHIKGHKTKLVKISLPSLEVNTDEAVILEDIDIVSHNNEVAHFYIKKGKVIFKNVRLQRIKIHLEKGILIIEPGTSIEDVDVGVLIYGGKFEGLERLKVCNVKQVWKIPQEEETKKIQDIEIKILEPGEIILDEPVLVSGFKVEISYVGDEPKARLISTKSNLFKVTDGGSLIIKNLEIEQIQTDKSKQSEAKALIEVMKGKLDLVNSTAKNSSNSGIYINSSRADITGSVIKDNNGSGIVCEGSVVKIEDSFVDNNRTDGIEIVKESKVSVNDSVIRNNESSIVMQDNSKVEIIRTKIEKNGEVGKSYPQVWIENSEVKIREVEVVDSVNGTGIYITKGSKVSVNDSVIRNNESSIVMQDNSKVEIIRTKIEKNGEVGKSYPQVWIENSEVKIREVEVVDSVNGTGIYITKGSKVSVNDSVIRNNESSIVMQDNSKVEIIRTKIEKNGEVGKSYPQVWIENSECKMEHCSIKENIGSGLGIWIISGNVQIFNSEISANRGGIGIKETSMVTIKDCKIYENGSNDYNDGIGVYSDNALVTLENVKTWGNKWGLSVRKEENVKIINCEFKDGRTMNTGCFITTAVINVLGKSDDCYELNTLRRFRDEWLRFQKDGEELIREYYEKAPTIVEVINKEPESKNVYRYLWNNYIKRCIELIEEKKYDECKALYIKMIRELERRYLIKF